MNQTNRIESPANGPLKVTPTERGTTHEEGDTKMLLGFKAQHRVTGKFYNIWADDAKDARHRLAGYLKVPLAEIMYAQPSQAMGPDAIRFDPNAVARPAAPPAAPPVPEKNAPRIYNRLADVVRTLWRGGSPARSTLTSRTRKDIEP